MGEKMLFTLSHMQGVWFESISKKQEKPTMLFETCFMWFESHNSSHENLWFKSYSDNQFPKVAIGVWFELGNL